MSKSTPTARDIIGQPSAKGQRVVVAGAPARDDRSLLDRLSSEGFSVELAPALEERRTGPDAVMSATVVVITNVREGLSPDTLRCCASAWFTGAPSIVLAVDEVDGAEHERASFLALCQGYSDYMQQLGSAATACVPISTARGDNIGERSERLAWHAGPTLVQALRDAAADAPPAPFRMHVATALQGAGDTTVSGIVASGAVKSGDPLRILPGGHSARVRSVRAAAAELGLAVAGDSVTLTLDPGAEVGAGDLLAAADVPAGIADQFQVQLLWTHARAMLPGRAYLMKIGTASALATVTALKHKLSADTLQPVPAKRLERGDVAVCNISIDQRIGFDPFEENPRTGSFLLVDRTTGETAGAGHLQFALRRSENIHWQRLSVDKRARSALKGQRSCVLWFTGLSGAGKSTIANLVEKKLYSAGCHTYLLDGDNVRHGLNRDLGFTDADRVENIRRVAEVAKLFVDAGIITLVAFISPFRSERLMARQLLAEGEFFEVFIDTPLAEAEKRDPKGLYKKARSGGLKHFTGIDSPYEAPENPELRVDTTRHTPEDAADLIVEALVAAGKVAPEQFDAPVEARTA